MNFIDGIKGALLAADIAAFRFINGSLHNDLLAAVIKFAANDVFVAAVILAGLYLLAKAGGKNAKINTAFALWTLIAVNLICTFLLKPVFKRPRPLQALSGIYYLAELKNIGWSFPSTHTAMVAALAVVLWDDYRRARWLIALFVIFTGFFCVYTGGHYPSDVAAGFILGLIIGKMFEWMKNKYSPSQKLKVKSQK
jgi:membrane-associated phospholipid phosphatase